MRERERERERDRDRDRERDRGRERERERENMREQDRDRKSNAKISSMIWNKSRSSLRPYCIVRKHRDAKKLTTMTLIGK